MQFRMFELRVAKHLHEPGRKIFEVWNGEEFMANIYPTETGIKVISKHIADDPQGAIVIEKSPPIPALLIRLTKPSKSG